MPKRSSPDNHHEANVPDKRRRHYSLYCSPGCSSCVSTTPASNYSRSYASGSSGLSERPSEEADFEDTCTSTLGDLLVQVVQDRESLQEALAHLVRAYTSPDGDFNPPADVVSNLQLFGRFQLENTLPQRKAAPRSRRGASKISENMPYHASKLWGQMKEFCPEIILQLPPIYDKILRLPPSEFFATSPGSVDDSLLAPLKTSTRSHALQVYQYSRRIGARQYEDKIRYVVVLLAWQRVIETTKRHQISRDSRKSPRMNAKSKPRLTEGELEYFYATFFANSPGNDLLTTPTAHDKEEIMAWFNNMRRMASAYGFLAQEIGVGALFHLLPHFTESQIVLGVARNTSACTAGLAYLKEIGLVDDYSVLDLNVLVERLVAWIERMITGEVE